MTRIAVIGTGIMGAHLARRLAQAGFDVTGWNRTPAKVDALGAHGVHRAASPAAALGAAEIAIVMLSSAPVIDALLFDRPAGADAAPIAALAPGGLVIVMSSIPVDAAHRQAEVAESHGLAYLDAPVSGGEPGARDGTLAILVGGAAAHIERAMPVFAALGRPTPLGPVGSGQLAKLANQLIVGATLIAIAEALTLASRGGADPAALREAWMGGFGDSKVLRVLGERMVSGDHAPGSPAAHQLKDVRAAAALAGDLGLHLEQLDHTLRTFESLADHGDGARDVSIVIREVARRAGAAVAA